MFCPKCGSILMPKKEGVKTVLSCSCGFKQKSEGGGTLRESVKDKSQKVEIIEVNQDLEALPKMLVDCPKCKHHTARYWLMQTRAGDEPETKFLKCEKCGYTWRDYN